jgi:hypothetical protein
MQVIPERNAQIGRAAAGSVLPFWDGFDVKSPQ